MDDRCHSLFVFGREFKDAANRNLSDFLFDSFRNARPMCCRIGLPSAPQVVSSANLIRRTCHAADRKPRVLKDPCTTSALPQREHCSTSVIISPSPISSCSLILRVFNDVSACVSTIDDKGSKRILMKQCYEIGAIAQRVEFAHRFYFLRIPNARFQCTFDEFDSI